jgi:DNA replication protein DnaT
MSRHATDWAWETDPGSSSLKLILLSMADRADEYNLCYPSIERLVKDTCLNKKTVQAGLISLMKMGLISDTGERKGATKRVRVFSLNITKNGNIKGNREGGNEPENGNVPENGNIPKNGMLNDPKNGMLNDPKNGMLNDPKNGIQNQSYNQSFNQERESRTKSGDSVPHDPGANNAVMNNFAPPGGPGQLGKFVMHEQCQPVSSCHALFCIAISPLNRYTNSLHRDFYFPGNGAFSATSKTRYNDKNFALGRF